MSPIKVWLGKPYPLGATWRGNGVNFALYSEFLLPGKEEVRWELIS
jgi:pullulanase/glycogen debranching enzyme